jgi:hypothetical protein
MNTIVLRLVLRNPVHPGVTNIDGEGIAVKFGCDRNETVRRAIKAGDIVAVVRVDVSSAKDLIKLQIEPRARNAVLKVLRGSGRQFIASATE